MADREDVRRIALALPEVTEGADGFGFGVRAGAKRKGFAWSWMERVTPKKPRVARPDVLVARVPSLEEKQALLDADPDIYFTEPHYNNYPAVLVRLPAIGTDELKELLTDAWRSQAPRALQKEFDG
jgi:hypothetical protein